MNSEEPKHKLNSFFVNLQDKMPLSPQLQSCLAQINELDEPSGFPRQCLKVKLKIIKILQAEKDKLQNEQFKMICGKLKVLGSDNGFLEKEGLINLYLDIYDLKKRGKKTANRELAQIAYKLLRCLEGLIKFFFLQHELQQYRKYKKLLPSSFHEQIQGLDEAMEAKIKQRVLTKKCGDLFKQYLKNQEKNNKKQLCRVCYKKITIEEISKHVDLCGKRTYIKQQLTQNFQKRLQILSELEFSLFQLKQKEKEEDLKNIQKIEKVIQFYRTLKKDKNSKRMSIRYQDRNPLLFFFSNPSREENEKESQLMALLCSLEDKAFCLNKKLQEVQSQLNEKAEKNPGNTLKMSLDYSFKKYQSMSKDGPSGTFSNCLNEEDRSNRNKKKIQNKCEQIREQQDENETPVIVRRSLRKKMSEYERRYSSTSQKSNASETNCREISIKNFEILKLLGKGAFGRVYLVRRKKTNDIYALKAIKIDKNWGEHEMESIKNEYSIYKRIEGDHLVAATFSFHQKNVQFFVLEYMPGGDLSKVLEENTYLEEDEARFYLAEILLAIEHLHRSEIVHRDLKPQNIVLDSKGHLKLTDFGLSQCRVKNKISKALEKTNREQKQQPLKVSTNKKSIIKNKNGKKIIGTPDYIAPEIIQGTCLTNPIVDWWSFGVIAYEMIIGCRPFSANSVEEILANIQKGEIQWPPIGDGEDMISPVTASFIKGLLTKNFEERLGFKGIEEIKNHKFFEGIDWKSLKSMAPPLLLLSLNQKLEGLPENQGLRKEIQILMGSEQQNPLQELRNYVRYDLLTAQTLESAKEGAIHKERRIRKLKSIASNFEKIEPKMIKGVLYKPALSSEDESS